MISSGLSTSIVIGSLLISLAAYVRLSRREGTFVNVLTPSFIISIPALYLLQLVYVDLTDPGFSSYAYVYVYGTLAVESWAFVYAYTSRRKDVAPARVYPCRNCTLISLVCLGLGGAIYAPVLLQFREYLS